MLGTSVQERIEASRWGRTAISALVLFVLAAIVVSNLVGPWARTAPSASVRPVLLASGLRQHWSMFAPNPSRWTLDVVAVIRFSDGSRATWTPPRHNKIIGTYRDYRWRKLTWSVQDRRAGRQLLRPLAVWLADQQDAGSGVVPVEVIFYRAAARTPPPGSGGVPTLNLMEYAHFYPQLDSIVLTAR